jgi:pSer/pThr/pTyr-binding forkhead associated (FHA) protein
MAILEICSGEAKLKFELTSGEMLVGRHPSCDLRLNIETVSRRHARIVCEEDGFYVEDLDSLNGTLVNGEAIHGRRRLADGDLIEVQHTVLAFHQFIESEYCPTSS